MTKWPHNPTHRQRGFSLMELAFVLLAASFILGGLWVAAGSAWDNYRLTRSAQQVTKATQNIREYYMNAQTLPVIGGTEITNTLDNLSLLPVEMRRNPGGSPVYLDHPLNNSLALGSFHIYSMNCPVGTLTKTCFRFRMQGLTKAMCISLLTTVPVNDADLGILGVGTQNAVPLQQIAASTSAAPSLVTPTLANTWCNQTGTANEVDWDFKLHD